MTLARTALLAGIAGAWLACGKGETAGELGPEAARGKRVYENVCTVCHNRDPQLAGALGPEIAGSSRELLEAKVLRGEYPPGHAPRRPGAVMPRYEYLAPNLVELASYLASLAAAGEPPR